MWPIRVRKVSSSCSGSRAEVVGVRLLAAFLLTLVLTGCGDTPLYSSVTETQANTVQAALRGEGILAEKRPGNDDAWAVYVPENRVPDAVAVLRARGLPREPAKSLGEVFEKEGFVSSPLEQRARYVFALSQELSRTFEQIDGVVKARVHLALPSEKTLAETRPSGSAAVVIVQRPEALVERRETDIKALVTDGVEGIDDVNRVSVEFFTRHDAVLQPAAGSDPDSDSPLDAIGGVLPLESSGLGLLTLLAGAGLTGFWLWGRRRASASRPQRKLEPRQDDAKGR